MKVRGEFLLAKNRYLRGVVFVEFQLKLKFFLLVLNWDSMCEITHLCIDVWTTHIYAPHRCVDNTFESIFQWVVTPIVLY